MPIQTRGSKRRAQEAERPPPPQPQKRCRTGRKGRESDAVVENTVRDVEDLQRKTRTETIESTEIVPATKSPVNQQEPVNPKNVFPFMKLPAELRLGVYRMALVQSTPLKLQMLKPGSPAEHRAAMWDHRLQMEEDAFRGSYEVRGNSVVFSGWGGYGVDDAEDDLGHLTSLRLAKKVYNDGLVPEFLTINREVYKEARQVLYGDNTFVLRLDTGIYTLSQISQRSRSQIKHIILAIPSHHDILEGFSDLVRLGLRYCWGLKSFTIILSGVLPDERTMAGTTSIYANAFHILRWLPRDCKVKLEGNVNEQVRQVIEEEGRLQTELDETSYLKRQHQMPERH
ncbi:hypothetical protein BDV96DRAFT_573801 [Lophiotrema nucula]|uniref:Uncharacterized protein n=1 Tax=Lophiotrema nucula TaxID=690887 RepID=A0A6A5ZBM6_9PLEO|nr:hypothetical protein BDV96DRAFT_573801 [Lophiotrema nucula]